MKISRKVVFAVGAAVITTAAARITDTGLPTDFNGWLALAAWVVGAPAVVGAAGYHVEETRPSPSAIRNAP
mgnify:FL=1